MTLSELFAKHELPDLATRIISRSSTVIFYWFTAMTLSRKALVYQSYQISLPISPQKLVYGTRVSNTAPIDGLTQMRTSTSRQTHASLEIDPRYFSEFLETFLQNWRFSWKPHSKQPLLGA